MPIPEGNFPLRRTESEPVAKPKSPLVRWLDSRAGRVATAAVLAMLMALSAWLVWDGLQEKPIDAPLPPTPTQTIAPGQKPTGPLADVSASAAGAAGAAGGNSERDKDALTKASAAVENGLTDTDLSTDDGWTDGADPGGAPSGGPGDGDGYSGSVSVASMKPMSVMIPSIKSYSGIKPTHSFVKSKYRGMGAILVPRNPRKVSWYDQGAPLVGGQAGYTALSGHVAWNRRWGSLHNLAKVKPGEVIFTKDANGRVGKWMTTKVYYLPHTQFPQKYWQVADPKTKKPHPRTLVVITCGGKVAGRGYVDNVFVEARPVG